MLHLKSHLSGMGAFFKDERSFTISNRNVIVLSNNDVILRSEGGRGSKKAKKLRSSLKNPPYAQMHFLIRRGYETEILSTSGKYHKFQTAEWPQFFGLRYELYLNEKSYLFNL